MNHDEAMRIAADHPLGDAFDEPDTGVPPCLFCRRTVPCECDGGTCMCSCGRCQPHTAPHTEGATPQSRAKSILSPR